MVVLFFCVPDFMMLVNCIKYWIFGHVGKLFHQFQASPSTFCQVVTFQTRPSKLKEVVMNDRTLLARQFGSKIGIQQ